MASGGFTSAWCVVGYGVGISLGLGTVCGIGCLVACEHSCATFVYALLILEPTFTVGNVSFLFWSRCSIFLMFILGRPLC